MRDGHLRVVYASDDGYAGVLGVSLTSLYENNRDMDAITVYILRDDLSEESKAKLDAVSAAYGREPICWIEAKNVSEELSMDVSADRGSLCQYARLFISSCLPADLDRVLYLDCDVLVRKSLLELWNLDMQGKTVAALKDAFSRWYRRNLDMVPDEVIFNSGVMLVDLKRWRAQGVEQRLLSFIKKKRGRVQQGDQGALSATLTRDVLCFDPKYNAVTIFYDFTYREMLLYRKPPEYYPREAVERAAGDPAIVHFTSSFLSRRPWVEGCRHPYLGEWLHYKQMCPWSDEPLRKEPPAPRRKRAFAWICRHTPRWFYLRVAGVLQAYVRPAYRYVKGKMGKKK